LKIYINKAKENWIVDNLYNDLNKFSFIQNTNIFRCKIIWILAPWTLNFFHLILMIFKKTVVTVHHIEENKLPFKHFKLYDKFIDCYHVISPKYEFELRKLTNKKIVLLPFWIDSSIFYFIESKNEILTKWQLEKNKFYIGSFQRDTEGSDLQSPKYIKGPDRFLEICKYYVKIFDNVEVILTGKRRQFIINKLQENSIPFKYFEMVNQVELNELYNILNLYIVSSRVEGGPRAIFEAAISKTPIISTDVGIAKFILHHDSIFDMKNFKSAKPNTEFAFNNVSKYEINKYKNEFKDLLNMVIKI